ncbi:MAG: glucosyltransferase domain-containing protein [Candidatus Omnitrophica bacterium]|nr:glucosyltransferase domain-containing protein [Candidatus Omnitrophota bacterium]
MTLNLNRHIHRLSFWFILFFISLTILCLPTLMIPFAHHDDLSYFDHHPKLFTKYPYHDINFSIGRYTAAYFGSILSWFIYRIDDLKWIRLFNIVQLSLAGALIVQTVNRWIKQPFQTFLITLTLFSLPPFQIFIAYSGIACFFPAIWLSLAAAVMVWDIPTQRPFHKRLRHKKAIGSCLLFLCAITTYPSAAMLFWGVSLGFYLIHLQTKKRDLHLILLHVFISGISCIAIYAGLIKIIGKHFLNTITTTSLYNPYSITTDFWGKLTWFFKEPLFNVTNFWNIFPNVYIYGISILFILGACFLRVKNTIRKKPLTSDNMLQFYILPVTTIIAFTILSYLPNLLATGQAPWYRCSVGLTTSIFCLMIWSGYVYFSYFLSAKHSLPKILLSVLCLTGSYSACQTMVIHRVIPSCMETQKIITSINRAHQSNKTFNHIHFIVPYRDNKRIRYDEFGVLSSQYSFNIPSLINLAYKELNLDQSIKPKDMRYSSSLPGQISQFSPKILVIDLSR